MKKVVLEACTTCSLNQPKLRALLERLQQNHQGTLEVSAKECLELCQDDCAFRLNGAKLIVPSSGVALLENKINEALTKS